MGFFHYLLLEPMYNLYLHLPYVGWEGKYESQICAAMTGIQERHWLLEGQSECSHMIDRNFSSKVIVIRSIFQLYLIISTSADLIFIARRKIFRFFFVRIANDPMCE